MAKPDWKTCEHATDSNQLQAIKQVDAAMLTTSLNPKPFDALSILRAAS